jgi:hypothetical protein
MPYAARITFVKGDPMTGDDHDDREAAEAEVDKFRDAIRNESSVEGVQWYAGHSREIRSVQVIETGLPLFA